MEDGGREDDDERDTDDELGQRRERERRTDVVVERAVPARALTAPIRIPSGTLIAPAMSMRKSEYTSALAEPP